MADLDDIRSFLADEHGLAVVATVDSGGGVLTSVGNGGVIPHPISGEEQVAFVSAGAAARLGHIRRGSPVTITIRRGWKWRSVSGPAELIGPDEPVEGVDGEHLRSLLREIFVAAGGEHDDFDEYDRVMAAERRVAVLVTPATIRGNR